MSTNYNGWKQSLIIANEKVEAVIVPEIGRIMQFRFKGKESPFWEEPALFGQPPDPDAREWVNFGGDKTWPAPQADWPKVTPRSWPPPQAFDSMPVDATIDGTSVRLISPTDPHYGIRTLRRIEVDPVRPVMRVATSYEKVRGEPVRVSVWIITQLREPVGVFARVPDTTRFEGGYVQQTAESPRELQVRNGLLSLRRRTDQGAKIGMDTDRLLWIGERQMLLVESPRVQGAEYPDGGSSAEVWSNPDPKRYVELELLGPLQTLKVGDRIESTVTYTLELRRHADPEKDARAVLFR